MNFEDALQYYSAKSVKADYIITRNTKDFTYSDIKVLTPREFNLSLSLTTQNCLLAVLVLYLFVQRISPYNQGSILPPLIVAYRPLSFPVKCG